MSSVIKRKCVVCGEGLKITVNSDKTYVGGNYFFGKEDGIESEYWECDRCFIEWPEKEKEE